MKNSLLEAAKMLLIVVLICTMVLLFAASIPTDVVRSTPWLSTVLQPFSSLLGLPAAELTYVSENQTVQTAAQPLTISIRNSAGLYTAQWDSTSLDTAYETLGGMLGQALDTAEDFEEVRQFRLTEALKQPSVFFDYQFSLPVSLVASWLDAKASDTEYQASRFVLALENGSVWLYLMDETPLRAATQVDAEEFSVLLEQFQPDGSAFAFETESHLAPLSIIPSSVPRPIGAQAESVYSTRYVDALANNLGFNPYDTGRYTDSSGVTHFSETGGSLKISADGTIHFTATTARITAPGSSMEALVEAARSLLNLAVDISGGSARLYLSGITREENQTTCHFDYVLRGVPVRWPDGSAATVVFTDQTVTELRLNAVTFTFTDTPQYLLPPAQTSAILPKDGRLQLQYHVSGNQVSAGWAK